MSSEIDFYSGITRGEHETTEEWTARSNVWLDKAGEFLRKKRKKRKKREEREEKQAREWSKRMQEAKGKKRDAKEIKQTSSAIKKTARRLGKNRNSLRDEPSDVYHLAPLFFKIYDRIRYREKNPKKAKAILNARFHDAKRRKLRKRM